MLITIGVRPAYVVDKRCRCIRAAAGMGFARGAVPWQQIRENVILKLAACAAREIIAHKKARVRMLETENAALRDKIEQAERAIRPLLK